MGLGRASAAAGGLRKRAVRAGQSVDVETALRSFTVWAAHQMFLEDKVGTIEPGKYADLAVWDRDPLTVPTDELRDMACEMTVFNGEVVFEREG